MINTDNIYANSINTDNIYADDSIMQKGCPATAGSKILENYIALFDATIISRLKEKLNPENKDKPFNQIKLSEFGLGKTDLPSAPLLCNDVFGHVRCQAVRQGLCYIRPTYGTVSRFGLIPVASSMDQIGIVCKNPAEGFSLLSVIAGHDEKDGAMFPEKKYCYKPEKTEIKQSSLPPDDIYADVYKEVLKILAYAELSGNLSRYDGIKFGYRTANYKGLDELYTRTRTEALGLDAKLAIIMGGLLLSNEYYKKYYEKAMKIRRLIKQKIKFEKNGVISVPVENHAAVLAGLPSLSFSRNGKNIQLIAEAGNESLLFSAWEASLE